MTNRIGSTKMRHHLILAVAALAFSVLAAGADTTPYSAASKTYQIAVSNVSSTPVQVVPNNPNFSGCVQYLISNTGTQDAWVVMGTASAGTTAVAATTVTPSTSFLVPAGSSQVRTAFQNAYIAAITAASTTTLNVTCGSGAIYSATTSAIGGGTVTSDQGAPAATANAWPVKVTDGTDNNVFATNVSVHAHKDTAIPAGGTAGAGLLVSSTSNYGVFFGSGAPTLSAAKGSLYLRSNGTTTNDRAYINTDGGTTWTALTTVA